MLYGDRQRYNNGWIPDLASTAARFADVIAVMIQPGLLVNETRSFVRQLTHTLSNRE